MAQVEIDETELSQYRTLSETVKRWMGNPDARRKVLEAQKAIDPNAIIPELDAAKPLEGALAKMDEKLTALDARLAKDAADREQAAKIAKLNSQWESGRSSLRSAGYTEEGIKKVEELMEKEGIANHDAAAAYYDKLNPPEVPVAPSNSGFDVLMNNFAAATGEDEAGRKAMFENPDQWANTEIAKTLNEIRYGKK